VTLAGAVGSVRSTRGVSCAAAYSCTPSEWAARQDWQPQMSPCVVSEDAAAMEPVGALLETVAAAEP